MQEIFELVDRYRYAIHTQTWEDFAPLWAEHVENVLISPTGYYVGTKVIYEEFLLGRIRSAYSRIDLISHHVDVRQVSENTAVAVFSYSTDCRLRETGEPFGIAGLETQVYVKQAGQWKLTHVHYSKN